MKIQIFLIVFILLFTIPLTNASPVQNGINGKYIQYWESGNDIYNFSVKIDGNQMIVFNSLTYGSSFPMMSYLGKLKIIDNYLTPILYYGNGKLNTSVSDNIDFSIENVSNVTYVKLSNDNYYGVIISNAAVSEYQQNLTFDSNSPYYFLYMTLPVSYYVANYDNENSSTINYSSYTISNDGISNYSLNWMNSSVNVIERIESNAATSDQDIKESLIFVNSMSPEIIGTGYVSGYIISLSNPFNFELINQTGMLNTSLQLNISNIPSEISLQHSLYAILYDGEIIGTANVFGYSYLDGSNLIIPTEESSFIIQFKPANYSVIQRNYLTGQGNISLEIYANRSGYFIPLSPAVQVTSLNVSGNLVISNFYQYQNSTIEFFIPSGYRITGLSVNGNNISYGSETNGFTVTRIGNQTVAIININETGEVSMAISLSKLTSENRIPLFTIFLISAIILIIVALGLIYYARRKSIEIYEKNN
ncbi:MAG: hypothetical protein ACP5RG_03385 [Thermoplasmata archaeon]